MKERLLEFLNSHNLTSTRLADTIGVQRSSISHILSGRNKPSYDFIHKFLQHYRDINPKWLILGEGSMYTKEKQTSMSFERPPEQSTPRESNIQKEKKDDVHIKQSQEDEPSSYEKSRIEKIVIFYSDSHFEEYTPREKK
jgi:transcriptional regulator with XRE-family HTH domain